MLLKTASCPNENCEHHRKGNSVPSAKWYSLHARFYTEEGIKTRYKCLKCGKTFLLTYFDKKNCVLNDYNVQEIAQMYRDGTSLEELSETLGVEQKRIYFDIEGFL